VLKAAEEDVADRNETQHIKNFFADADSEVRFARIRYLQGENAGFSLPTSPKLQPRYFPQRGLRGWQNSTAAALESGHLEVARLLLGRQRRTGLEWQTALQAASGDGHLEMARLLLDWNADVNAAAKEHGRTLLQVASEGGHLEVVQLLLG
jgi:hypothetical protein